MHEASSILFFGILSYFLGAIPFGLIIAKMRNVDLYSIGSGNIGATNVFRGVGKIWGLVTLVLDALKGFIPATLFPTIMTLPNQGTHVGLAFGILAILGHTFPVYLRFKGGKGVATSAGVLSALAPAAMCIGVVAFTTLFVATRYVSVASMGASCIVAIASWFLYREGGSLPMALTCLAMLVVWRHRTNIQRLIRGEEDRLTRGG